MTSKFLRVFLAVAVTLTISAVAQTGSAPATGAAATPPTTAAPAVVPAAGPTKVGTINIEGAIFGCNEGRREEEGLQKKYEPKQAELKNQNDELEGLKKQLTTTQDKLSEDALATLKKQIESKQKLFDRAYQDFQEEINNQNQEIATKVLQKMAPMIVKYSQENGFGIIVDTSKIWPQSNILWWAEGIDITKAVVDAYNVQSGVPAPTGTARPAAPKPGTGTGAAKPAAPAAPKQ
jgi:outer membrane protein